MINVLLFAQLKDELGRETLYRRKWNECGSTKRENEDGISIGGP